MSEFTQCHGYHCDEETQKTRSGLPQRNPASFDCVRNNTPPCKLSAASASCTGAAGTEASRTNLNRALIPSCRTLNKCNGSVNMSCLSTKSYLVYQVFAVLSGLVLRWTAEWKSRLWDTKQTLPFKHVWWHHDLHPSYLTAVGHRRMLLPCRYGYFQSRLI